MHQKMLVGFRQNHHCLDERLNVRLNEHLEDCRLNEQLEDLNEHLEDPNEHLEDPNVHLSDHPNVENQIQSLRTFGVLKLSTFQTNTQKKTIENL